MDFDEVMNELSENRRRIHQSGEQSLLKIGTVDCSQLSPEDRAILTAHKNTAMQEKLYSSEEFAVALKQMYADNPERLRKCQTTEDAMKEFAPDIDQLKASFGWST